MNQIPMSSMDLNHAAGSLRESGHDLLDAVAGEGLRLGIVIGESHCAGGHDICPSPCVFGNRPEAFPWPVGTGFASGMGQLHTGYTALLMNEADDSGQRRNVIVTPDTQVLRTDAALGNNGSCLGKHQSSPAHGAAAQMHEMPVVGISVGTEVLAHGRDKHTVGKREISNRERIEQVSHGSYIASLNLLKMYPDRP